LHNAKPAPLPAIVAAPKPAKPAILPDLAAPVIASDTAVAAMQAADEKPDTRISGAERRASELPQRYDADIYNARDENYIRFYASFLADKQTLARRIADYRAAVATAVANKLAAPAPLPLTAIVTIASIAEQARKTNCAVNPLDNGGKNGATNRGRLSRLVKFGRIVNRSRDGRMLPASDENTPRDGFAFTHLAQLSAEFAAGLRDTYNPETGRLLKA
jgi:hypothetical protein